MPLENKRFVRRVTAAVFFKRRLPFRLGQDRFYPVLVVQIPAHRLPDAVLEFVRGRPAEFALDFRCVNGVTAIVAEPVFDERNQLARIPPSLGTNSSIVSQINCTMCRFAHSLWPPML